MVLKVALVTGAGSGIGRAVALALAKTQYAVVLAGRRAESLERVARQAGSSCLAVAADVTEPASVEALFARI
ncbi:MAG: SDR family NAD(P)-dependent oxidoreductase, partial [Gammaproteobacteria bacterium]